MSVLVLRADFEQAGRQRFINVCYDLADQSERIFDLHPDIRDSERALMKSPHRTAVTPAVYDRMMDGMQISSHVIYALGTGNRAFIMAKNRMRYLSGQRHLSSTPQ